MKGRNYRGRKLLILSLIFLLSPAFIYAQTNSNLRDQVIEETLKVMEAGKTFPSEELPIEEKKVYFTTGLQIGYLKGNTAYDFAHHTSELEFPMDNGMMGGNFALGFADLSLNTEAWVPFEKDAGFKMKDRDWIYGYLVSETTSRADMDAIIWDTNLRYDFYKEVLSRDVDELALLAADEVKIGALLGYRYERFDYDLYDLYYDVDITGTYQGQTLYQGTKIGTYKIQYYLPYLGLVTDVRRQNWGIGIGFKYSFHATAKDVDNHLLRGLTFYGDYNKGGYAYMGSINAFYNFTKSWKLKIGTEVVIIRIDGRTWEESHDPDWDQDQSTDSKQFIFWSGIEYKF